MIADTSFIIDLMREEKEALDKAKQLSINKETIFITTITLFELFSGLERSKKQNEEKQRIESTINSQLILGLEEESGKKAGEIHGTLIKEGNMLQPLDCLIAGIALVKNEKVITKNVKDFSRVKGLKIESY